MSVVRNFPAVPNRIAIGCEFLQLAGERGIAADRFERALAPLNSKDDEDVKPGTTLAEHVLNELRAFRMVAAADDGVLRLAPEWAREKLDYAGWHRALVSPLRRMLTEPDEAAACDQRGVPDVLGWLLCQDPSRPILNKGEHATLLGSQFRPGEELSLRLGNDQMFQNLIYWARYIGLAETFGFGGERDLYVIPDPTRAIRDELPAVFRNAGELTVDAFVERLAERLPVLEHGSVRTAVEQRMQPEFVRNDRHFSPATSLALRRLAGSGVLRLSELSDAPAWALTGSDEARGVSHVQFAAGVPS